MVVILDECAQGRVDQLVDFRFFEEGSLHREKHGTEDDVLDHAPDRRFVGWQNVLVVGKTDVVGFCPRQVVLEEVEVHFISVKVSVVGTTVGVVHSDGLVTWQHSRDVTHQRGLMQSRLSVK